MRLENSGGMVHSYRLSTSQLQSIKEANILVAIDKMAASGGYLMACVCLIRLLLHLLQSSVPSAF